MLSVEETSSLWTINRYITLKWYCSVLQGQSDDTVELGGPLGGEWSLIETPGITVMLLKFVCCSARQSKINLASIKTRLNLEKKIRISKKSQIS